MFLGHISVHQEGLHKILITSSAFISKKGDGGDRKSHIVPEDSEDRLGLIPGGGGASPGPEAGDDGEGGGGGGEEGAEGQQGEEQPVHVGVPGEQGGGEDRLMVLIIHWAPGCRGRHGDSIIVTPEVVHGGPVGDGLPVVVQVVHGGAEGGGGVSLGHCRHARPGLLTNRPHTLIQEVGTKTKN